MKRTPGESALCLAAKEAAMEFASFLRGGSGGGFSFPEAVAVGSGIPTSRPVMRARERRTNLDRQRMMRVTRAGRECQLRIIVPQARTMRLVVNKRTGGRVSSIQNGVRNRMRMNNVVSAGLVVADVAVRWVERKSVNAMKGSSRMLHLEVNSFIESTMSSKVFWWLSLAADEPLLCPLPFSPVHPVEESGEYLRVNMPSMMPATAIIGPAYLMTVSPYSVTAQKAAMKRKLSQGSPVVHDTSPTSLLNGRRKGCE